MNVTPSTSKPVKPRSLPIAEPRGNDLERRRELGQFFTPRLVAVFMWEMLEIINGGKFPTSARVIDPACGEGVFLCAAANQGLPAKCLFGGDIDETLLPAWRETPQLRGASVRLANGLLELPDEGIVESSFDVVAGNPPFSGKGMRELLRLLEVPAAREEMDLFGTSTLKEKAATIQPLSQRERAELDRLVRALSRYSCWRLNAAEENDAVSEPEEKPQELFAAAVLEDRRRPTIGDFERTARLIAQWPKDRLLDMDLPEVRDAIRRMAGTAIEVFFTERFLRLAKPGGLIGMIVPESIVASDRMSPLRRWLVGRMDLLASISLPQKVFTGVGANAKTTILFARRRTQERPAAWDSENGLRHLPDKDREILMVAPRLDAPEWTLEMYLASVLNGARKRKKESWQGPT
jgi:hypothetical protein